MDASSYLYAMAAVGMSFAGLSVLTMILGQMLGGQMNKFDGFVARSWVQLGYPSLTYFHEADKGGHFAAWEEPELFATEIRAAFKSLRT